MTRPTDWTRTRPRVGGAPLGGGPDDGEGQPPSVDCCDPDPSTDRGADGIAWALGTVASELNEPHGTVADGGGDKTFTNPTNTNDGDDATFATRNSFAGGAGTYVSILRTDLGAAYEVTGMTIVGGAGASGSDFDAVPWYVDWSDDGTTWTNTSMTQVDHADTPVLNSATSVITLDTAATHRYWRIRHETTITGIEFRVALFVRTWDIAGLVTGGWTIRADPVIDGADATYETVTGTDLLRVDLGSALRIVRTRIRIAANTAGARTFTIKGANAADFSDEVTLTTIAITATGSYTAQDVEATWSNATSYRYYELSIGTSDTYRIHAWELYEGTLATDVQGVADDLDAHVTDTADAHDASAISIADAGGHFTATDVEGALAELASDTMALDDLSDVTITSPATGARLRYDGATWVDSTLIWRPVMTYDGTNWLVAVDGSGNAIMTEA